MKTRDSQRERRSARNARTTASVVYVRPKSTYAKFAGKCLCGADISKNAWVRFRKGRIAQCVVCRPEGSMAQDERDKRGNSHGTGSDDNET